jgi:hypothetical protein
MKLDLIVSSVRARVRYLTLALPLFAIFSTLHTGCIRGAAGYGHYGIYGYGNRATAAGDGTLHLEEGECVMYGGREGHGAYDDGTCDDTHDGYGSNDPDGHVRP